MKHITPEQCKDILRDVIKRNIQLADLGKMPIAISLFGQPGCAKTSLCEQISEEFDAHFIKLNLAEKEIGDLMGNPISVTLMQHKTSNRKSWIVKDFVPTYLEAGHIMLGETKMTFALPDFIHGKDDKPVILVLDDFNRGNFGMLNAVMNIIDRQCYSSWKLPKGSTVILTANPDDDDSSYFNTSSLDSAQNTRYIRLNIKPSVADWALQMEKEGLEERFINFLSLYPEIIEDNEEKEVKNRANLRIWTKFFNLISFYPDLKKAWDKVFIIGSESLPEEHLNLFYSYINDTLNIIPNVKEILNTEDFEKVLEYLEKSIGSDKQKRLDISAIFSRRLISFTKVHHREFTPIMRINLGRILETEYITPDLALLALKTDEILNFNEVLTDVNLAKITGTN